MYKLCTATQFDQFIVVTRKQYVNAKHSNAKISDWLGVAIVNPPIALMLRLHVAQGEHWSCTYQDYLLFSIAQALSLRMQPIRQEGGCRRVEKEAPAVHVNRYSPRNAWTEGF